MEKTQKIDVLIVLYTGCIAISELMGGKTFPLLHTPFLTLNASVALFVVPFIYCITDIITEVYGRKRARSIVRAGLGMIFLFFLFSLFAVSVPASQRFFSQEKSYEAIFRVSARISLASLTAFAIGELVDIVIFANIRKQLGGKALWLRTNIANILSQFVDTALFMTLAFYALNHPLGENIAFLFSLILPYWILKCIMSVIETPFVYAGVKWLTR